MAGPRSEDEGVGIAPRLRHVRARSLRRECEFARSRKTQFCTSLREGGERPAAEDRRERGRRGEGPGPLASILLRKWLRNLAACRACACRAQSSAVAAPARESLEPRSGERAKGEGTTPQQTRGPLSFFLSPALAGARTNGWLWAVLGSRPSVSHMTCGGPRQFSTSPRTRLLTVSGRRLNSRRSVR